MKNLFYLLIVILLFMLLSVNIVIYFNKNIDNIIENDTQEIDELEILKRCEIVKCSEHSTQEEIEDITPNDEKSLEEQEIEDESFELQGNIAYEGDSVGNWNVELGEYKGLTYYNQNDSRWKNKLYTSTNNKTQTIGSSGCGPTAAAIIVSSIKGTIFPDEMADLFVEHGYRSPDNGTYWSAFRAIANEFNIEYTETLYFSKMLELVKDNNYVVCSVGNGLFTTGGHYIVIVGVENDILKIFDPYLYKGKFDTSTRKNKVVVNRKHCILFGY